MDLLPKKFDLTKNYYKLHFQNYSDMIKRILFENPIGRSLVAVAILMGFLYLYTL